MPDDFTCTADVKERPLRGERVKQLKVIQEATVVA